MAFDSKEKMDRGTILIVDDDDINLAILENIFMPYYNVITAGNGLEGLEKIMADPERLCAVPRAAGEAAEGKRGHWPGL